MSGYLPKQLPHCLAQKICRPQCCVVPVLYICVYITLILMEVWDFIVLLFLICSLELRNAKFWVCHIILSNILATYIKEVYMMQWYLSC